MQLRADPAAIAPERAIVFEIAGSVVEFYLQAQSIGLEYLADDEAEFVRDDDFHPIRHPERDYEGRIYLAMPDLRALQELLRLWRLFKSGARMASGFGMWTKLFERLKDVRPWGPSDRVLPETIDYWRRRLEEEPGRPVRFEVELWYRESPATRARALLDVSQQVRSLGGRVVHHASITEIRYEAALVELPADGVEEMVNHPEISLGSSDEIMFVRPQSIAVFDDDDEREGDPNPPQPINGGPQTPIAALLDGFPIQNHQRLRGRLVVDDPDGLEPDYSVRSRRHGTEMASLILHGDINAGEEPLSRPLYVRPVLRLVGGGHERTPHDQLVVDVIYRAVRRIKEGDGDEAPSAPGVLLINLSLGDLNRPFTGPMSPWARLLDYLSYRYRVLFFVSAGNILDGIELPTFDNWTEFSEASAEVRESAVLTALHASKAHRTLLSPAESLNALTVGAAHADDLAQRIPNWRAVDPFDGGDLPNVSSALGLGHRRIVKPDIFMNGGRELVRMRSTNPLVIEPLQSTQGAFGLRAAAPDPVGADLTRTALTCGTSAATALATRAGHRLHDVLMDESAGSMHADVPEEFRALLIKALLVHGSAWGRKSDLVDSIFGPHGQGKHDERKDNVARLLGYGFLDTERAIECAENRATLLGHGVVSPGGAGLYRVPLPEGMNGVREFRAITITVTWFSPINARHQGYRMTSIEAGPGGDSEYSLAVERASDQPHFNAVKRGSVFHERRSGERAAVFVDNGDLLIRVSCRATAGEYDQPVPYAIAVSLEVGVGSAIQVYQEVRQAIATRLRA